MIYAIKRGDTTLAAVKPEGKQSKKIMDVNVVDITFTLPASVDFTIGDYVEVYGERYQLHDEPGYKKESVTKHTYTLQFKGMAYELSKPTYLTLDENNNYTIADFNQMGNAGTFIDLLIANANRLQSGWVKGTVDETDFQNLSFSGDTCLSVLAKLATTYNLEWWVDNQTIHLTKKGEVQNLTFEYGKGKGLYDITRSGTDKSIATRVYAYGSTKNLAAGYKGYSSRLKLPGSIPYLQSDTGKLNEYGIIEHTEFFEDIYPHRTGLVTQVTDPFTFTDSQLDFDINAQQLDSTAAKVIFNTGLLAGYQFELRSYQHSTKTLTINANQDEKDFVVPSARLNPAVGDQYVLVDINMPQSYIDAAEQELLVKAQAYLVSAENPVVKYAVTCDPLNFKERNIALQLGNYVRLRDADFGLDADIRITAYTRDLQNGYDYTLELAESVTVSPIVRNYVSSQNLVKQVERIKKGNVQAYNAALQAKAAAEGAALITDYWGVTLDPAHGIVATGTVLLGSGAENNAGITGVTDRGNESVRFWAGSTLANRDNAPFQVLEDGAVIMTQAFIHGEVNATGGKIGDWVIANYGLTHISENESFMIQRINFPGGGTAGASIGTNILPASAGLRGVGYFENSENNVSGTNYGVVIDVKGGLNNRALQIANGDVWIDTGRLVTNGPVFLRNLPAVSSYNGRNTLVVDTATGLLSGLV